MSIVYIIPILPTINNIIIYHFIKSKKKNHRFKMVKMSILSICILLRGHGHASTHVYFVISVLKVSNTTKLYSLGSLRLTSIIA